MWTWPLGNYSLALYSLLQPCHASRDDKVLCQHWHVVCIWMERKAQNFGGQLVSSGTLSYSCLLSGHWQRKLLVGYCVWICRGTSEYLSFKSCLEFEIFCTVFDLKKLNCINHCNWNSIYFPTFRSPIKQCYMWKEMSYNILYITFSFV